MADGLPWRAVGPCGGSARHKALAPTAPLAVSGFRDATPNLYQAKGPGRPAKPETPDDIGSPLRPASGLSIPDVWQ